MADLPELHEDLPPHHAVDAMMTVSTRAHAFLEIIPRSEIDFSISLIMGKRKVKISGRYSPTQAHTKPRTIVLPDLRSLVDYARVPCKHECVVRKQYRHVRQAYEVWTESYYMQRALMLSIAGQCGVKNVKTDSTVVQAITTMDRFPNSLVLVISTYTQHINII